MGVLWTIASFIVALGLLVFVHEFGHFYIAKRNKVKVLKFAIGFGKPLFSWRDKSDTEYVIGAIPLGGYVRMLDSRVDEVTEQQYVDCFDHKTVYQRIAIVAAGPLANFLFAIVALFLMYLIGVAAVKPVVGSVESNSPAQRAGLVSGGEINAINGETVTNWRQAQQLLVKAIGNPTLTLTVSQLGGERDYQLNTTNWEIEAQGLLTGLGITPFRPNAKTTIAFVVDGAPADIAGIKPADTILAINDKAIESWQQAAEFFRNSPDTSLNILIKRGNEQLMLTATPENKPTDDGFSQGFIGLSPQVENWPKGYVFNQQYAIFPALTKSLEGTWGFITLGFTTFAKLFTGDIGLNNLSGPISIAQGAGASAQGGVEYFLYFLAYISVSLGVVNLLPLPVLDGGHLMYFFVELIRGKPVSERVQEMGFKFGAFVLMMIMGIAIINDFARL